MDIEVKPRGSITMIRLRGRIVDGEPATLLQDALRKLVRAQRVRTVIDVEEVSWFDSLAIGILVSHYISVSQLDGGIVLVKANEKIRELMRITKLEDRFGWADDFDEASRWFDADA